MRAIVPVLALALLAGCASDPARRDADNLALYREHAGAPVDGFTYLGRFDSWTPLGSEALVVWTTPTRAWLLDVHGPCSELPFARAIKLSSSTGRVSARFDDVTPIGSGMHSIPCRIREIRPIDVPALREARRQARAAAS